VNSRRTDLKYVLRLTQVDVVPRVQQFDAAVGVGADKRVDEVRAEERVHPGSVKFALAISVDGPAAVIAHRPLCGTSPKLSPEILHPKYPLTLLGGDAKC
jgi:hypothetical protein